MKKILLLAVILSAIGCAQTEHASLTGAAGKDGKNGVDGKDGVNGTNGAVGATGATGATGAQGAQGVAGPAGAKGATGATGATGANGTNGTNGTNGKDGKDGINGIDGSTALKAGVSCNLHDVNSWSSSTSLPQVLANNPAVGSFNLNNFSIPDSQASAGFPGMPANLQSIVGLEGYALDCSGLIYVPTSGLYTFKLLSDDGSRLLIEDQVIIENQGLHAPALVTATAILNRGFNRINVVYYQGPFTQIALQLKWSGPNTAEQVVPAASLTHF